MRHELEVQRALGRIEAKVDALLNEQNAVRKDVDGLKRWRAWMLGMAAGISAVVSFLFR